ncbi:hypothetical protein F5Y11DRAFT_345787 [Daldinia sp. FL1419]|nr:hypothetical protein F5Y11DRAFT_345787 [Daldinia sp. FL1419]
MKSFVTLLAAAASLQGGSAAPFGNQPQPDKSLSHGGFPHPTGDFPLPTGFPHPTEGPHRPDGPGIWARDEEHRWPGRPHPTGHHPGDWHPGDGHAAPTGKFPWQPEAPHPTPRLRRDNKDQEGDHKEPWGFAHPTGHHRPRPHPSGGFPHPTGHPGNGNGFWRRDVGGVAPPSGFLHPTSGPSHQHPPPPPPPGGNNDHGRGNGQGWFGAGEAQEKRDEDHHRLTSISWPSGIISHIHPQPTAGVRPGHVQQPDGEPKREREILQEVPRVVRDAN